MITEEYQKFSQEFGHKQELQRCLRLAQLEKEAKLLPLKREILTYIDDFTRILNLNNEWFLRSRFEKDPEKKKLAQVIWKFYNKLASRIILKLERILP